jgi:creatinine amidohydrolase
MNHPSRFWADLSTRDFTLALQSGLAERTVTVLPVAATEQHGPHLPLSVDQDLVDGVLAACLAQLPPDLPLLFLPTQAVGRSAEHERFPGTLSLSAETTMRVWMELGESVARAGVKKLLLFNGHGGQQSLMDIVARDLRCRHGLIVYSSSWYSLPIEATTDTLFSAQEQRFGMHAGEIETSMMLALRPQCVDMAQARDFPSSSQARAAQFPILGNGRSAKLGWQMQDYNSAGAAGNAANATAEKGRAVIDAAGLQLALLLQELVRLPLSTLVDQPDIG